MEKNARELTNERSITIYRREVRDYIDGREAYEYFFFAAEKEMICRGNTDILLVAKDAAEPCGRFILRSGVEHQFAPECGYFATDDLFATEEKPEILWLRFVNDDPTVKPYTAQRGYTARDIVLGAASQFGKYTRTV